MISRQRLYQADKHAKRRAYAAQGFQWLVDYEPWPWQHYRKFTACSCWACGNPRRHYGELSAQHKRALLAVADVD